MTIETSRVPVLDGLRGIAALWVLVGHAALMAGVQSRLLNRPDLGVDLFIILSGFLMVFHYRRREAEEPWRSPRTWRLFWLRRFLRVAPLYYVVLVAALALAPAMFDARAEVGALVSHRMPRPDRFLDQSLANILAHVTFLFGLHPDYASRTPLPDWSLSLEMQFYALFPFMMLLTLRMGWLSLAVLAAAGVAVGAASMLLVQFSLPSLLPLKLHLFLAGMAIAAAVATGGRNGAYLCLFAIALALVPLAGRDWLSLSARALLAAAFVALVHAPLAGGVVSGAAALLGSRAFSRLGDLSYGAYLIHLLVMTPTAAWLIRAYGIEIDPWARFAALLAITMPATYALALAGYALVERPARNWGRRESGSG